MYTLATTCDYKIRHALAKCNKKKKIVKTILEPAFRLRSLPPQNVHRITGETRTFKSPEAIFLICLCSSSSVSFSPAEGPRVIPSEMEDCYLENCTKWAR